VNADQIRRSDFPADGTGYDRASVDAHLAAVAAWAAALEAQIASLGVERNALRRAVPDPTHDPLPSEPETSEPEAGVNPQTETGLQPGADLEPEPEPEPEPDPEALEASRSEDEVSARLVATRLALEGVDREEIVARLAEDYEIEEADALVDDVLARLA